MTKKLKTPMIPDTEDAWLSGELGRDEQYVAAAPDDMEATINEQLELQPISIRLEKSLIEDFKLIAEMHGLGYQPLMRQSLRRFADCEKKRILREAAAEMAERKRVEALAKEEDPIEEPQQKAA